MHITGLIQAFIAEGTIKAHHIVCAGSKDGTAVQASDYLVPVLGVSTSIDSEQGQHVDVIRSGLANVVYGETIARGDPIASSTEGQAKLADAGNRTIGFAEVAGEAGDIGSIFIVPGMKA